jgi:ATP-dependent Lon protease
MEVIHLSGYTEEEKLAIAMRHLIPRQVKENGLTLRKINFSKGALELTINEYTQEAGVRNLEREISAVCRKTARKVAEGHKGRVAVTRKTLHKFLGVPRFIPEMEKEASQVGLSRGLAWTSFGGEVLYVEVTLVSGKGELIVTGQIGEVMQESARAAVSYTRANLHRLGLEENYFENLDIHIHVPAGAIPKDGPSAGTAMAVALISVVSNQPVSDQVAMTGEITLRGRVLPIGGLKEKSLGALRAGIRTIVMPEKNHKDLMELPKSLKRKVRFIPVGHMDEVLAQAIPGLSIKGQAAVEKKRPARRKKSPAAGTRRR